MNEAYLMVHCVTWYLRTAHEWALVLVLVWELLVWLPCCVGDASGFLSSPPGVGGASFLGGILSLMASSPFASANDVILWFGEKPCSAENINDFYQLSSQVTKWEMKYPINSLSNKIYSVSYKTLLLKSSEVIRWTALYYVVLT